MKVYKYLIIFLLLFCCFIEGNAQNKEDSEKYLCRAEEMYAIVWNKYRVSKHDLFAEYYPSNYKDSLTYMQGGNVSSKEVSFLWPYSGIFSATNVLMRHPGFKDKYSPYLDSMVTGIEAYRDTSRKPAGYQAYPVKFEKVDRYYDDNGLVGIDYMEAYKNTKNPVYLHRAKEVFKFIISGWDDKLGGGVYWLEGHKDMKPACTNGMATLAALKIYEATKEPYYLEWGQRFYSWMHENLRNPSGVYWNDKKMDGSIDKTYWTYNSGSMLEASVLLYRFTDDDRYLKEAQAIASGALEHFESAKEDKNLALHIDLPWFVTVLFRGYEALYEVDGDYKYLEKIIKSLDYAWDNTRDQYGLLTHTWTRDAKEIAKPKWLLDEACIAELYARISMIKQKE
jgi:uncharacterized protein YyaL (SSP411 family)